MRFFRRRKPVEWNDYPEPAPVFEPIDPTYSATHQVTPVELLAWLRTQFTGHHVDDRVTDAGWGWWINPQPDAFLDGNQLAGLQGIGPWLVIKRDGSVRRLAGDPISMQLHNATSEDDFYAIYRRTKGAEPFPDHWMSTR